LRNRWSRTLFCVILIGCMAGLAGAQTEEKRNFPRFNFNAGGSFGIGRGDMGAFVGNSFAGVGGAGWNFNRWVGVDAEYMYYNMSFRPSVARGESLGSADGSLNVVSINGLIRPPYHVGRYGFYGILGADFFDRNTYSSTGPLAANTLCQPSWRWWDIYCFNGRVPASPTQSLGSFSKVAGGYNFGGGLTYSLTRFHRAKIYGEFRIHKAYFSDSDFSVWPITFGLRW